MTSRSSCSLVVCAVVVALALPLARVAAQESFYKGKTIRLIVGLAPGGGFDTYSRVIARHMGRHIPGNPILVVASVRLLYVESGWRFVRMLDLKGHETPCSLLVKFDIHDV